MTERAGLRELQRGTLTAGCVQSLDRPRVSGLGASGFRVYGSGLWGVGFRGFRVQGFCCLFMTFGFNLEEEASRIDCPGECSRLVLTVEALANRTPAV